MNEILSRKDLQYVKKHPNTPHIGCPMSHFKIKNLRSWKREQSTFVTFVVSMISNKCVLKQAKNINIVLLFVTRAIAYPFDFFFRLVFKLKCFCNKTTIIVSELKVTLFLLLFSLFLQAWFPYNRPDCPDRPDRTKQCTDDSGSWSLG